MINQARVKECFNYNHETGVFTRKLSPAKNAQKGSIAGSLGKNGYLVFRVDGKIYQSHRLAWLYVYGEFPKNEIDHINHVKTDNRISNLRDVTTAENQRNAAVIITNKSGFTGVCWHKGERKWRSQIRDCGVVIYLGSFLDKADAIASRKEANIKYGYHKNHGTLSQNINSKVRAKEMDQVNTGDKYASKLDGFKCTVINIARRGKGFQITYKIDGMEFGLITSRGNFLDSFVLVKGESNE